MRATAQIVNVRHNQKKKKNQTKRQKEKTKKNVPLRKLKQIILNEYRRNNKQSNSRRLFRGNA